MKKSVVLFLILIQIVVGKGQTIGSKASILPSAESLFSRAIVSEGDQTRLQAVFAKAKMGRKIVIGVLGGSITEGAACRNVDKRYANVVLDWWKKTFPQADFKLVNAGIGATGSNYGAMRVKRDLLSESPDFVIVEFAVNDANNREDAECYEGVVRQVLNSPQKPALLLLFMMKKNGTNAQEWESRIGSHYGLPMISYRDAIWPEIETGKIGWEQISPDVVHPNEAGHLLAGELISGLLEKALLKDQENKSKIEDIPLPLLSDSFEFTTLADGEDLIPLNNKGWIFDVPTRRSAGWKSSIPGSKLEFEISGKIIYLSCWRYKGPMGKVKVSIDGSQPYIVDAWFDQDWGGYRYIVQIGKDLKQGKHIVKIELLPEKNAQSTGNEFRILCLGAAGVK